MDVSNEAAVVQHAETYVGLYVPDQGTVPVVVVIDMFDCTVVCIDGRI